MWLLNNVNDDNRFPELVFFFHSSNTVTLLLYYNTSSRLKKKHHRDPLNKILQKWSQKEQLQNPLEFPWLRVHFETNPKGTNRVTN